jgi:outer membrane lipoprotein SlyB
LKSHSSAVPKPFPAANLFWLAVLTVSVLCFVGCKQKSDTTQAPPNAVAQPTATQPSAPAAQPAAAPTGPVPSFSAAQKVGLYAYPAKGQGHDQQLIDESDCYNSAQEQTGVNPEMAAPQAPSSAEVQAAQAQAAEAAPEAKGGRAKGAAKGAVGGAVIGGIAGNAGAGAAIGATAGTVRGGRQQRKANEATKQQASDQAGAQVQQQYQGQKAAYNQQMDKFKRAFSACMDAKGYSVK